MITHGADDWDCFLCDACSMGFADIARLMIDRGATDWNGGLINACIEQQLELVSMMLERGATNAMECLENVDDPDIAALLRNHI
jgi:hypothetical protein